MHENNNNRGEREKKSQMNEELRVCLLGLDSFFIIRTKKFLTLM